MSYRARINTKPQPRGVYRMLLDALAKTPPRVVLVRYTRTQLESLLVDAEEQGNVSVARMIESELARRTTARDNRARTNGRAKKAPEPQKPQRKWWRIQMFFKGTRYEAPVGVSPEGLHPSEASAQRAATEFMRSAPSEWREKYEARLVPFTPLLSERLARVSRAAADIPESQKRYAVFEKDPAGFSYFRGWYATRKRAEMVAKVAKQRGSEILIKTPQEMKDDSDRDMLRMSGLTEERVRENRTPRTTARDNRDRTNGPKKAPEPQKPDTSSPAFKRWFGASEVVNADGTPKVLYHGTQKGDFTSFQFDKIDAHHPGFFFTDNDSVAWTYSESEAWDPFATHKGQGIYRVYVRMVNPFVFDAKGVDWSNIAVWPPLRPPEYRGDPLKPAYVDVSYIGKWAKSQGYDGAIIKNVNDVGPIGAQEDLYLPSTVYIVFDPKNIKSAAHNRGTWDSNDPDIRHNPQNRRRAARPPRAKRNSGTYGFEEGTEAAEVASAIGAFIQNIGGVPVPNRAFDHGPSDEIALTVRIIPETRPYFVYGASPKGHLFRAMERHLEGLGYRFSSESADEVSVYRDPFR